jgi:hypothetical protein
MVVDAEVQDLAEVFSTAARPAGATPCASASRGVREPAHIPSGPRLVFGNERQPACRAARIGQPCAMYTG